jgi:hypothetical protein
MFFVFGQKWSRRFAVSIVGTTQPLYGMITNDVSDYINLLVRIARIICNHPLLLSGCTWKRIVLLERAALWVVLVAMGLGITLDLFA